MAEAAEVDGFSDGLDTSDSDDNEEDPEMMEGIIVREELSNEKCQEFVYRVMKKMQSEEMLKVSCRGELALQILDIISQTSCGDFTELCVCIVRTIEGCIRESRGINSSIITMEKLWRCYHQARFSESVKDKWEKVTGAIAMSSGMSSESDLTLQLLFDRCMKLFIAELKSSSSASSEHRKAVASLSAREKNAIRYMAGYVMIKLKKKFQRKLKKQRTKHQLFVRILKQMKAPDVSKDISSLNDYSHLWMEQVDRGGLLLVSIEVCAFTFTYNTCSYVSPYRFRNSWRT